MVSLAEKGDILVKDTTLLSIPNCLSANTITWWHRSKFPSWGLQSSSCQPHIPNEPLQIFIRMLAIKCSLFRRYLGVFLCTHIYIVFLCTHIHIVKTWLCKRLKNVHQSDFRMLWFEKVFCFVFLLHYTTISHLVTHTSKLPSRIPKATYGL